MVVVKSLKIVTYVPIPQEMLVSYSFSAIVEITQIEEKEKRNREYKAYPRKKI